MGEAFPNPQLSPGELLKPFLQQTSDCFCKKFNPAHDLIYSNHIMNLEHNLGKQRYHVEKEYWAKKVFNALDFEKLIFS